MASNKNQISERKKDHIDLCLSQDVNYNKTNGFEKYDFEHNAITEINFNSIDLSTTFFNRNINYPFLISCMTGGTEKADNINAQLAAAAEELNIPVGVGSQREFLESNSKNKSYTAVKSFAPNVPRLSNIGAAQVAVLKSADPIIKIIDQIEAAALVIHVNPLQELIQDEGQPSFKGLLKNIEMICGKIEFPVIVKEVGTGISKIAASKLLDAGIRGIDVAGSGGTSWSAVEMLRNNCSDTYFWNWGLPTSYCLRTVSELKEQREFLLVSSGGVNTADEIAKSIALGADIAASAKMLLRVLNEKGLDGVIELIQSLFEDVKKIMYLTGCSSVKELNKLKLIKKEDLY